jgi:L-iditol 2-dehydrogenase
MRAVVVTGPGQAKVAERPPPRPEPGEVLIDVAFAAICGTDRKLVKRGAEPALVPGHEVAGYDPEGTPVGIHPDVGCKDCRACRHGWGNRCPNRVSIGLDRDGGLAEQMVAPAHHVVPLGGVPVDLAPLLEPMACALHAVRLLDAEPETPAVVVGAGAMGILSMWALQAGGAEVVVCQRSEPRRGLAAELGAREVVSPDQDPSGPLGAAPRVAIVSAPGSEALSWAMEHVAVGGVVHAFAGSPEPAPVDANVVHYRQLKLVGSTGSTLGDYLRARDLVADGTVPLQRLPRETTDLAGAVRALTSDPPPSILRTIVDLTRGSG